MVITQIAPCEDTVHQARAGFRRPVLNPHDCGCTESSTPRSSLQTSIPRPAQRIASSPCRTGHSAPSDAFDTGCGPNPSAFHSRSYRRSRRLLFTVADVVGPDLRHRDLASLQLPMQLLLHHLRAQRDGLPTALDTFRRCKAALASAMHRAYRRPILSSTATPQASRVHRQTIIVSVFHNRCTVGSPERPTTGIHQGRSSPSAG